MKLIAVLYFYSSLAIQHLTEEVEKEEQRLFKENLKKIELKKKQALERKKPFDLMTERRQKEKEIQKIEHPSIGNVKVQLATNRTGKIVVREGDEPELLADNFMALYSLPRIHKQTIINKINQVFARKALLESQKRDQKSYNIEENSSRNLNSGTEESDANSGRKFFNIPSQEKISYSGTIGEPVKAVRPIVSEAENENPNQNMMSPHFRGQSNEQYENQMAYHNIPPQNQKYEPQNPKLQLEDPGEFVGFSQESSESYMRRGSASQNSDGKLLYSSRNSKRSGSKQRELDSLILCLNLILNYRKI